MSIGLCATGLPWTAGFVGRDTLRGNPRPLGPLGLMDLAVRLKLTAIELPIAPMPVTDGLRIAADFGKAAADRGLGLVVSTSQASIESLTAGCEFAKAAGSPVVRCILS